MMRALITVFLISCLIMWAAPAFGDEGGLFYAAINAARARVGVAPLTIASSLQPIAQQWTNTMAACHDRDIAQPLAACLAHNPNLVASAPVGWTRVGENVGAAPNVEGAAGLIEGALEASHGHYTNMVDPTYASVVVATARSVDGALWVTEDFLTVVIPSPRSVPVPAPASPIATPLPAPAKLPFTG